MPRVIVTEGAVRGLERCRDFLERENPLAARRAADAISASFDLLETMPEMGRPAARRSAKPLRELLIPFGRSGYVALYYYDAGADVIYILAFRHGREAGY